MIFQGKELANWIASQQTTWAKFTLKSKILTTPEAWERTLKTAFTELSNIYPKANEKRRRVKADRPKLLYATFLGGDRQAGILLHAQGVVEVIDDDLNRLQLAMNKSWEHATLRELERLPGEQHNKTRISETPWLELLNGSVYNYIYYISRHEGAELGNGIDKLVPSATVLVAEHYSQ